MLMQEMSEDKFASSWLAGRCISVKLLKQATADMHWAAMYLGDGAVCDLHEA